MSNPAEETIINNISLLIDKALLAYQAEYTAPTHDMDQSEQIMADAKEKYRLLCDARNNLERTFKGLDKADLY